MSRAVSVQVGPLATADADGISTSQAVAAAQSITINGALTDGTTANNIAQSQTPGAAGNLTLNGTLVSGGVAYLGTPRPVYITCAGNNSGRTFTVTGTTYNAGGGPIGVSETVTGANTSVIQTTASFFTVTSISISGASTGAVTVGRAGVATMDKARRIIVTSGGNDTGITFTITGTDWSGTAQTETVTGVSGAAASSTLSFLTVSSVTSSGAAATTVQVGTNGVADSQWVRFDDYGANAQVAIQVTVAGTINYTISQTLDDPNVPNNMTVFRTPSAVTWVNHPDSTVVAATATAQANYAYPPIFARLTANSGTGTAVGTFRQVYQS